MTEKSLGRVANYAEKELERQPWNADRNAISMIKSVINSKGMNKTDGYDQIRVIISAYDRIADKRTKKERRSPPE